jgi:aminoglycoside phosphotransferase family enzyme
MDDRYQRIVAALRGPDAYVHESVTLLGPIDVVETHVSHLFMTADFVYKIKKPVDLGFVDLSTLELRRSNCEAELRLN